MLGINIFWQGKGLKEIGYIKEKNKNKIIIKIDKKYFRPNEVDYLKGDASKALKKLKFKPKYTFKSLVKDMLENDMILARKELYK
jgi:GDPmannose 4,6-dehydratase